MIYLAINWDALNAMAAVAAAVVGLIGLIAAFSGLILVWLPYRRQLKDKERLEREFGIDVYPPQVIENSARYYVEADASSVDPSFEAELRNVISTRQKMFEVMDNFLNTGDDQRYMIILADSGMGKTSAVLTYYSRNQRRGERERHRIAVVPLGYPNADEKIAEIPDKRNTVLFLDAFDEDTKAINDHRKRLTELMDASGEFKRVLITCRTQFFPNDEEIPVETGIARLGSRSGGEGRFYEFYKLYLQPLTDAQVDEYLRKRYPLGQRKQRRKAKAMVDAMPLLSVRPMLLTHIPDLLEKEKEFEYSFELYEAMVEAWLEREKGWVDKEQLRKFSELLAVDIYINREKRGAERISPSDVAALAQEWGIDLPNWKLTGRSLLNRDAEGNLKFSHRSIMEYLYLRQCLAGNANTRVETWTDQMNIFFKEIVRVGGHLREAVLSGADLRRAVLNRVDLTGADLTEANLSGAYLRGAVLSGADLAGAVLTGADLAEADLHGANLSQANLILANLSKANLRGARNINEEQLAQAFGQFMIENDQGKVGWISKQGIRHRYYVCCTSVDDCASN